MTTITSILSPERCKHDVEGGSQKKLFEKLSLCLGKELKGTEPDTIFQAFYERELLGSTGLGQGIAIPHCRLDNATQVFGCLFILENNVDFNSLDNQAVDIIFAIIAPSEAHEAHLNILAQVAQLFSDREFCKTLRQSNSDQELYQAFISRAAQIQEN